MDFADKVRQSREKKGLTQQQLADLTGVSRRVVVRYETGRTIAHVSTMRKLAAALGVSYKYLSDENVTDPEEGLDREQYVVQAREEYGEKAAKELDALLEKNMALFAGGELSQDSKDDFFNAVMKAYLTCKKEARKTYGRKDKETIESAE